MRKKGGRGKGNGQKGRGCSRREQRKREGKTDRNRVGKRMRTIKDKRSDAQRGIGQVI